MSNEQKIWVLFDLEETIIDDWHSGLLLPMNCIKIRTFISLLKNKASFGIFSNAIWNEKDLNNFNSFMRESIEQILEIKLIDDLIFIKNQWMEMLNKCEKIKFSKEDFDDIFLPRKDLTLWFLARNKHFKDTRVILIDDMVKNSVIEFSDFNTKIETVNVKTL